MRISHISGFAIIEYRQFLFITLWRIRSVSSLPLKWILPLNLIRVKWFEHLITTSRKLVFILRFELIDQVILEKALKYSKWKEIFLKPNVPLLNILNTQLVFCRHISVCLCLWEKWHCHNCLYNRYKRQVCTRSAVVSTARGNNQYQRH